VDPVPDPLLLRKSGRGGNNDVCVLNEMYFKAHEIATRQGISHSQLEISRGWIYHFMKRSTVT
jgi:hypothetical protein